MQIERFYRQRRPAKDAVQMLSVLGLAEQTTVRVNAAGVIKLTVQAGTGHEKSVQAALFKGNETDLNAGDGPDIEIYTGAGLARFREGGQPAAKGAERAAAR
jgi:hypothetical protein